MTTPDQHYLTIAEQLGLPPAQVRQTAELLDQGATVPFIARYRKEATGSLDEVAIGAIRDNLARRAELDKRREAIIEALRGRELLSAELRASLEASESLSVLEDLYLPYRPKRRTRATIARERGLEPLADLLLAGDGRPLPVERFLSEHHEVASADEALAGAQDILAERFSEDARTRSALRELFRRKAVVCSKVVKKKQEQAAKFRDYFDWQEPVSRLAGHRLLALLRGENEGLLSLSLRPPEDAALAIMDRRHVGACRHREHLAAAAADSYRRLLAPSLENELRRELKERADAEAIAVFADNLRQLLLAPPLGQKRVLALDPGYRTGAKLACLDAQGGLLHHTTIYPTHGEKQREAAARTLRQLVANYQIEAIAIGSGTASRETETFVRECGLGEAVLITLVNEDGASIYSASEAARREFPDHDITVRGAVSIGRRLQDPLAELVKIDPKSIGVGQYQHDVNQTALKTSLDEVVSHCVNSVGVELNTASVELLSFVSGLGAALAAAIVKRRNDKGPFSSRAELLEVPRLGARAFEQAAGFLRIRGAADPLDASGVHPERYTIVEQMAADAGATVAELMQSAEIRSTIRLEAYLSEAAGLPTLHDIMAELARPGRDPRSSFSRFSYAEGVQSIEDLQPGMMLPAIITNVTTFGAFADIGVHQDGLIHISQLADRFVKDPAEVVRVRQQVEVRVLEVDLERRRISLSLKKA